MNDQSVYSTDDLIRATGLQVLGVIDANLLAAYSSNLFGIVCVALVKIRHVRPYKRKLILEAQAAKA